MMMLFAFISSAISGSNLLTECYAFTDSTLTISNIWKTNRDNLMEKESLVSIADITTVTIEETVQEIGVKTFWFFINLENLIIPNSVSKIHDCAFYHCHSLESIDIPDSVSSIGNYGFSFCISLISVTIPSKVIAINQFTFSVCHSLILINFDQSSLVDILDEGCFEFCVSLRSIKLPINLDLISKNAFKSCTSLQEVIYCGSKVFYKAIDKVFTDCDILKYVYVPLSYSINTFMEKSIYKILDNECGSSVPIPTIPPSPSPSMSSAYIQPVDLPDYTFDYTDLTFSMNNWRFADRYTINKVFKEVNFDLKYITKLIIKEGPTKIEKNAFYEAYDLSEATLPNSLQEINTYAFGRCFNLTKINFPLNLISIDEYAFRECISLREVVIPDSVAVIGKYAFYDDISLVKVVLHGRNLREAVYAFTACESLQEFYFCGLGDFQNIQVSSHWYNIKYVHVKQNYKYNRFSELPVHKDLNNECEIDGSSKSPSISPTSSKSPHPTRSPVPTRSPSPTKTPARSPLPTMSPVPTKSSTRSPSPTISKNYETRSKILPITVSTNPNDLYQEKINLESKIKISSYLVIGLIGLVAICFMMNIFICVCKFKGDKERREIVDNNENINEVLIVGS